MKNKGSRGQGGPLQNLSRRERQIMEVVFRRGRATAQEVHRNIPDPPSATAVRTMLRNLEAKGVLLHDTDGPRHVYYPATPREAARRSALRGVLVTFFGGSPKEAIAELLDLSERPLTPEEREELEALIRESRESGD